jgi:predicted  nucleic acid-binding Zn-ribbon protein
VESIQSSAESIEISASNIGGIDETTVELTPGVNVLAGRNATNRTSFLQTVMAAMGSDDVTLKGDADSGRVELQFGGDVYERTLTRTNGTVTTGGDPYLEDAELADLFAFLLESNESRRAVAEGADLRELIMRPVDTDAIQAEIEQLLAERRDLDERLDELESVEERLTRLERRRTSLEDELQRKRAELEDERAALDRVDADVEETREEKARLDETLDELGETRSELEDVRYRLETAEESLESLRAERDEVESEIEAFESAAGSDVADVDERIETLRERKRSLDSVVNRLQNLIRFNEDMLEGDDELLRILNELHEDDSDGPVTEQLLGNTGEMTCWTCGTEVNRDRLESTIERLRDISTEKRRERTSVVEELDELKNERSELEQRRDRLRRLEQRRDRLGGEIDDREDTIEDLRERRDRLESTVETLESEASELESEEYSEVLEQHRTVNELEFEIDRLENERSSVTEEIEAAEDELDERDSLRSRREGINDELAERRTRIQRLEAEAVDAFNEHMDTILDLLEYSNLDRIWIERTETTVREGRRTVPKTTFELHVIRSSASGASYEDTVDHLSESEREVTGLVFALAGYLVHEVYETVPFMVLDSLEAIDSERIATLVDYFSDYAQFLVVALLPEDAAALDDDYRRVTDI